MTYTAGFVRFLSSSTCAMRNENNPRRIPRFWSRSTHPASNDRRSGWRDSTWLSHLGIIPVDLFPRNFKDKSHLQFCLQQQHTFSIPGFSKGINFYLGGINFEEKFIEQFDLFSSLYKTKNEIVCTDQYPSFL